MSSRLDAAEMRALMEDFQAGVLSPRSVEPRDFSLPKRLSAEDLGEIRRRLARALVEIEAQFGRLLRRTTHVELGAINEIHAATLFHGAKGPAALVRCFSRGQPGWLQMPNAAAVGAIERILGRSRGKQEEPPAARPLSPLEESLLVRLLRGPALVVASSLGIELEQWKAVSSFREAGSYLDATSRPDPYRLSIELLVSTPEGPFALLLMLPIADGRSFARREEPRPQERMPAHLNAVPVELAVLLGHAELTLHELLNLKPGDVIPLELGRGEPALLAIDGRPVGRGQLGSVEGRLAVRLSNLELD